MQKVLIVEDDLFLADLMQDCLSVSYDVTSVNTGKDALEQLQSGGFNVIVLDWRLPDMDGLDIMKQYRQNSGTAKIIMLSGMRGRQNDGLEGGADRFITKPFKIEEIVATVKEMAADV